MRAAPLLVTTMPYTVLLLLLLSAPPPSLALASTGHTNNLHEFVVRDNHDATHVVTHDSHTFSADNASILLDGHDVDTVSNADTANDVISSINSSNRNDAPSPSQSPPYNDIFHGLNTIISRMPFLLDRHNRPRRRLLSSKNNLNDDDDDAAKNRRNDERNSNKQYDGHSNNKLYDGKFHFC